MKGFSMQYKIIVKLPYSRDLVAIEKLEFRSMVAASQFHGDFWNANFAWSDKFCSTMYALDQLSHRWQKAEVIN